MRKIVIPGDNGDRPIAKLYSGWRGGPRPNAVVAQFDVHGHARFIPVHSEEIKGDNHGDQKTQDS